MTTTDYDPDAIRTRNREQWGEDAQRIRDHIAALADLPTTSTGYEFERNALSTLADHFAACERARGESV